MSTCRTTFPWADGEHSFALPLAQLEELQEKCNAGPAVISDRLGNGGWIVQDIYHTLRLGLIGGGMEPIRALELCRVYVKDRPMLENVLPARLVLQAAIIGLQDLPGLGKAEADGETSGPPAPTGSSTSATSTDSAP